MIENIFKSKIQFQGNFVNLLKTIGADNQAQTAEAFSEKWVSYAENTDEKEQKKLWDYQKEWYLKLYDFKDEKDLAHFLSQCEYVFDAGCGLGYLSEWFAALSPKTKIIAMDISDSVCVAAERYKEIPNIYFMKGDIANTPFKDNAIDYVSCHAVIMHTENPEVTFRELSRILKPSSASGGGGFSCYIYAKKALPRELVDDYFRIKCKEISYDELRQMSEQLSELGKRLQALNITFESPEIPLLGIKGGQYDIQRFIYWNFLKCYYNAELGWDNSVLTNFDWYSPSNARRYTQEEFKQMGIDNKLDLIHFHVEEACFGARFAKN